MINCKLDILLKTIEYIDGDILMKKKLMTWITILCVSIQLCIPTTVFAAENYKNWNQSDSRWGSIPLGSSSYTMDSSGCLVTAIAMLMVHSGCASADSFNPGSLCTYLNSNNGFTSGGELYWSRVNGAVPGFMLEDMNVPLSSSISEEAKAEIIANYVKQGYSIIVGVNHMSHWVGVDRVEDGRILIMDSANDGKDLFEDYSNSGITRLVLFSGSGDGGEATPPDDSVNVYDSPKTGYVNCAELNVRSGAGTSYSAVTQVIRGTELKVTGETRDGDNNLWYQIENNNSLVYVFGSYVSFESAGNSIEAMEATGTVNCTELNVRSGPGTDYARKTGMSYGQKVPITGKTKDSGGTSWYRIELNSGEGFVCGDYLTVGDSDASVDAMEATGTVNCSELNVRGGAGTGYSRLGSLYRSNTVSISGKGKDSSGDLWYRIDFNGVTGYVFSAYITIGAEGDDNQSEDEIFGSSKRGTVNEDYVNVRSDAGTGNSVVVTLPYGTTVKALGQKRDSNGSYWLKITTEYNGQAYSGYMYSDYINFDTIPTPEPPIEGTTGTVIEGIYVRTGAGTSYTAIDVLYTGMTVTILEKAYDENNDLWYGIRFNSGNDQVEGYVFGTYVFEN